MATIQLSFLATSSFHSPSHSTTNLFFTESKNLFPRYSHTFAFFTLQHPSDISEEIQRKYTSPLQTFSAALALSSIILSAAPVPVMADIAGLTPCKESKQFAKREKQQIKKLESSLKLYAPDSAPALAIKATIHKTKRRFDNYGKAGLLCGSDGLPHLIVSGDQRHWGEFISPGLLFLYIAGWIGWVGRSYLIAIRDEKKPTQKEIIIDVPLASRLAFRGFSWPIAAYRAFVTGDLIAKDV
ncbi:hypothetical protein I3843_09G146200 [Carya illinoinensis]|uniref:Photosystem I reaction center subunit III n=1 Tax=Carya illinoinensis TaxID=32201 RepID=A0A922E795_CARIL|nr:hypothetical protein I3842_09G150600 [Carya illinoinensis]KAG7963996.1 hypothetical protein I3843_09G146200 [Carya illinoinensis]